MAMFEGFDTDRNKLVDLHECFAVLVLTAKLPVVTRLRLLFELHDENGDDELSKVRREDLGGMEWGRGGGRGEANQCDFRVLTTKQYAPNSTRLKL